MTIDIKSLLIGVVIGAVAVVYKASVQVARNKLNMEKQKNEA